MASTITELDLPVLDWADDPTVGFAEKDRRLVELSHDTWIARNLFGFSILRYDDVVNIMRDRRWHNLSGKLMEMQGIDDPVYLDRRRTSILSAEGDEHLRLRRLAGQAFSPRAADALRPFMRDVVNRLIDRVAPVGSADAAIDICEPYPIPIICELLGAPQDDWQLFSNWATDIFRIFNGNLKVDLPVIVKAQDELDEYVRTLIAERRNDPRDDLLTSMIAADDAGDRLTGDEVAKMAEAVLMAGTDTTRNQLGCSLALFAEHPAQWKLLADQPELAPQAVEETMRFFGTVRGTGRFASEDIEYRDIVFPAGTFVMPSLSTANRDAEVFESPGTFDITREPAGKPQLTFGSGIHYCLGAALARAEQQEALTIMSKRLPDLAIAGEVKWKPSTVGIFGPESLPISFTANSGRQATYGVS